MKTLLLSLGFVFVLGAVGVVALSGEDQEVPEQELSVAQSPELETEEDILSTLEAVVYKSPTCGCCEGHAAAMTEAGIAVEIVETNDMANFKDQYGIALQDQSCHTTLMSDGEREYVVEGHIPVEGIEALWHQEPDTVGIALPGMPDGTPGMGGVQTAPYEVRYIDRPGELFITL